MSAMSDGSIIRFPDGSRYWNLAFWSSGVHSKPLSNTKYELLNSKGVPDHGPTYPEASAWHRPKACAPDKATISRSPNPMR